MGGESERVYINRKGVKTEDMKEDKTRITIRIEKDLLSEFRTEFPYRGELTMFILNCMQSACDDTQPHLNQIKKQIVGGR